MSRFYNLFHDFLNSGVIDRPISSRQYRQLRLINLTSLVLIINIMILGIGFYYANVPIINVFVILSCLIAVSLLYLLRKTHKIELCAHLIIINLLLTVTIGNIMVGGPLSPGMIWFLLMPITLAALLENHIVPYIIATIVIIAFIYLLGYFNSIPFYQLDFHQKYVLEILSILTIPIIGAICLQNLLNQQSYYEQYLEHTNKNLTSLNKKYQFMAHYDELTNVGNRTLFNQEVQKIKSNLSKGETLALFYIDIDNMKYINDHYGHNIGDIVLSIVAQRMNNIFRENDIFARIGGDEFAAAVTQSIRSQVARRIAERMRREQNKIININKLKLNVTTSIGIAIYPQDGDSIEETIKKADIALYYVKNSGRNNFLFYNELHQDVPQFHQNT